ncbi:MAG: hypothetical protein HPY75_10395, partial [Actinobacteria bacterium]|nr:hypothetical protein [Actinomycetota bacterium]
MRDYPKIILLVILVVVFPMICPTYADKASADEGFQWELQYSQISLSTMFFNASILDDCNIWTVGYRVDAYNNPVSMVVYQWDGNRWHQRYSGGEGKLYGVYALDNENVWAVGERGTILYWNGLRWTSQSSGTVSDIYGVFALDKNNVWAVGGGTTDSCAVILHWDGSSWAVDYVSPKIYSQYYTTYYFYDVHALDSNNAWAVGDLGIYHWDGKEWKRQGEGIDTDLKSCTPCIRALGVNDAWAVGPGKILHWDGSSWAPRGFDGISGEHYLNDIDARGTDDIWVTGHEGRDGSAERIYHWDGAQWSVRDTSPEDITCPIAVKAMQRDNILVLGRYGDILRFDGKHISTVFRKIRGFNDVSVLDKDNVWAVGDGGAIAFWNGHSWSFQDSGTTADLYCVSALDRDNVWAAGCNATILHWDGTSWSCQMQGSVDPYYSCFVDVHAINRNDVWATKSSGYLYHYDGSSWSLFPKPFGDEEGFWAVDALDENNIWIAGTCVGFWDGTDWTMLDPDMQIRINCISALDKDNLWVTGSYYEESVEKWVVMHWDGTTWSSTDLGAFMLTGISALDANHVWAVGGCLISKNVDTYGVVFKWDGSVWSKQLETYRGYQLSAIDAFDQGNIWTVGPGCTIYYGHAASTWYLAEGSTDGGMETWVLVQNPNPDPVTLDITLMTESGP